MEGVVFTKLRNKISTVLFSAIMTLSLTACENEDHNGDSSRTQKAKDSSTTTTQDNRVDDSIIDSIESSDDDIFVLDGYDANMTEDFEKKVRDLISDGEFKEALEEINSCDKNKIEPLTVENMTKELNNAVSDQIDTTVGQYFDNLDYSSAYDYIRDLSANLSIEVVQKKSDSLEEDYINAVLEAADKEADKGNYQNAVSIINKGISEVGKNSRLTATLNEYSAYLSVYITDLDYMSINGKLHINEEYKDNTGTVHDHSFYIDAANPNPYWADYYISGKYKSFSGTVGCSYENRNSKETKYFEIYGDDKLLYTSPEMSAQSIPQSFTVDISGITILRICYPATEGNNKIASIYDGLLSVGE